MLTEIGSRFLARKRHFYEEQQVLNAFSKKYIQKEKNLRGYPFTESISAKNKEAVALEILKTW